MVLESFHPAVARWFAGRFGKPTVPQSAGWPAIKARRHTLIAAPTGSGKTLAAFLAAIDDLVRQGLAPGGAPHPGRPGELFDGIGQTSGELPDETQVVYVSPLKALSNDIQRNLEEPLQGIRAELTLLGLPPVEIRTLVRTGDTPASARTAMARRPPHIFVTTPESLYILLTSEGGRRLLRTARTVIVDEIHALVRDKRGSHLALSLERLDALAGRPLTRIGLSATQRPIEEVARFLVGTGGISADGVPDCTIVDAGHSRRMDLAIEMPESPLEAIMSGEVWKEIYDRLAELIAAHRTTLVFVNTRRLAERVSRHLAERIGDDQVIAHHGSMAREHRLHAEERLKAGELRALVATASLELGIDIGAVDLVCQLGSPRSIATLLQRAGRSGHHLGGIPKGRIFPLSRDELVECVALFDSVRRDELDRVGIPEQPLDILAQQIVAAVAGEEEWSEDSLYTLVRGAYPYRNLARSDFDAVVKMLADGFATRRGRRSAYLHRDAVNRRLRPRRGARLSAITSGGAIPDNADYEVVLEPTGAKVGSVNEDFAIESISGDIFQLGSTSWRILRVEPGRVRVEDARGQPPTMPFWVGEAPARTAELSASVSRLRMDIAGRLSENEGGRDAALAWLTTEVGVAQPSAEQLVDYLAAAKRALGALPSQDDLVLERFFDESGGMQLVLHAPFGSRLNRAWGLALRKRFCQRFNFELQAAATEDAIVLSLGPTHSFPLAEVFHYLRSTSVREVLVQALLDAPMFATRWRWNVTRALAVPRWRSGSKVPPRLQRMAADDLLTLIFPDQMACAENLPGKREIPDHPLVAQTIRDCLEEAMDIQGLEALLEAIERGDKTLFARDLTEPSPLAQEILSARPYAFLDDAPLEERRTQAVYSRRWLDPETAADLGALDRAAIERVKGEAWPEAESADELHDALLAAGFLTSEEGESGAGWQGFLAELAAARRAAVLRVGDRALWVAAERLSELEAVYPDSTLEPAITAPPELAAQPRTAETALVELVRGRLEVSGPVTTAHLVGASGLPASRIDFALAALESEGFAMRGRFTPGATEIEWCERRLLARIHRATLNRLQSEIEPVSSADFMRFLLAWQRVDPGERASGPDGLVSVLEQLEGFEAPAAAWESEILPARLAEYDPLWLDGLCLAGRVAWARLRERRMDGTRARARPVRATPIALVSRENLTVWLGAAGSTNGAGAGTPHGARSDGLSSDGRRVLEHLSKQGASFFSDLVQGTGLLRTQVEIALGELVAAGMATADSFTGLRALLTPSNRRPPFAAGRRRRGSTAIFGMENAGRWTRLPSRTTAEEGATVVETVARALLRRYGVVFRRLIARESALPLWRDLLRVYRRLEVRGEIRGGRFVAGMAGEQYALPEAVGRLRACRRDPHNGTWVSVSAADPLNLVGIVTPGERVPALRANRVLFRDGVPMAVREAKEIRLLADLDPVAEGEARTALLGGRVSPRLRAYLGH